MRVLSMQNPIVWDILQKDKVYHADVNKAREHRSYKEDIEQLNGSVPIWCFAYPEISFTTMYNNELLEQLRCEMSMNQDNCWDNFYLFEIEIEKAKLKKGLSHNGSFYCKVFAELTFDMVQAVYKVRDSEEDGWYFKVLTPIYTKSSTVITTTEMDCRYWESVEDTYTDCFIKSEVGKCLVCGKNTPYTWLGKHFCCLAHMWKHKNRFIRLCAISGYDIDKALHSYERYADKDFNENINKVVDRFK